MKKGMAKIPVGLVLSGMAGMGLSAGFAPTAGAAVPSAVSSTASTATAARHPLRAWLRAHRREVARHVVGISAKTIGVTPRALVGDLRSGQSIAQVAQAHGVAPQAVANALVQAGDTRVSHAVEDHKLTQNQGAEIQALLPGTATKVVDRVRAQPAG